MKLIIKTLVIIIILQSCNNERQLLKNTPWINVKSGEIFELRNDSLFITEYSSTSAKGFSYVFKENSIILNDTLLFGIFQNISKDSLIIYDDSSLHQFDKNICIPVSQFDINESKEYLRNKLINNAWEMNFKNTKYRFDFTSNVAVENQFYEVFITENKDSIKEIANMNWWGLKEYNKQLFIVISDYNYHYIRFFQLSEINDSIMKSNMNFFNLYKLEQPISGIELKKIESLSNIDSIKSRLTSTSWKLKDYQIIHKNKDLFNGIETEFKPRENKMPLPRVQSKIHGIERIFDKYYLNKSLTYRFDENMKGFLTVNEDTIRKGQCELSSDGKFILTDPYSFLYSSRIVEIKDNYLILEKSVVVDFESDRKYEKWYVREELIKE